MCDTDVKLRDKVAIVTGGSSGIGLEAATELAKRGAKVIIASRNETKLKKARDYIRSASGNPNIDYKILDLGSLQSVRQFTSEIASEPRLDILINNAGAVALPDRLTSDDLNLTMQVNFFGSFLLTFLLLPLLKSSAPSRIINGSAASMYFGQIDFDHWNDIGRYNLVSSLSNSKLAMALYTAELGRRLEGSGVAAMSYDPFVVRNTDLLVNFDGVIKNVTQFFVDIIGQRKEDVGKQIAFLAAAKELEGVSGKHYKFCRPWWNHWLANDEQITKRLWDRAKELVNVTKEEDWEKYQ